MLPSSKADRLLMVRRAGANTYLGEPYVLDGYTQVDPRLVGGETTGVIFTYDQSNGANFVNAVYSMTQTKCHMVDPFTGHMFNIVEPMVGCNGGLSTTLGFTIGNVWAQTCNKLRGGEGQAVWRQRVIICCVGAGGITSQQFAKGGDCNQRIVCGASRLMAMGLVPNVVVRHQGESDQTSINTGAPGNPADFTATKIRDNIWSEVETLRDVGVTAPVLVCNVAYSALSTVGTVGYNQTRQGQQMSWDTSKGILAGPDTDTVQGTGNRHDDTHWNATGRNTVSTMFANAIRAAAA
jgi:hypothetical protein